MFVNLIFLLISIEIKLKMSKIDRNKIDVHLMWCVIYKYIQDIMKICIVFLESPTLNIIIYDYKYTYSRKPRHTSHYW